MIVIVAVTKWTPLFLRSEDPLLTQFGDRRLVNPKHSGTTGFHRVEGPFFISMWFDAGCARPSVNGNLTEYKNYILCWKTFSCNKYRMS